MDDFLSRARNLLGDVAGEAGRQAETMQLQAKLGALDEERDRQFAEAGKRARELFTMRQIHDDELKIILERVQKIDDEMMQLRQKLQDLRSPSAPEATTDSASDGEN